MTDSGGGFRVRPAREEDLDAIAGFEIAIARVSFGDEAIEAAALHRKRAAAALGRRGRSPWSRSRRAAMGRRWAGPGCRAAPTR